ncbi:hypothetical protein FFLO_04686 [Filobasidium floriforme]|uniref:Transcription and mRNA export factor SUS1 n=1 Tax=Filobasidium floriforme TaxID=5210 RepID=A0A8K0JIT2_9TREE|nr:transcription factor e(y)2-domain-containing protein [Filobasidium floriforme]KAG7530958.1 hypothetical protein FFLO_04686 [Filobasidium floriforme]KAH8090456.1 transcription factor e(y)2-domain-containing protein [Filobasidium floriforme]
MSTSTGDDLEQIQDQLQDRMIKSGEWSRIQRSLQVKLNEMGWADQVLSHAKETASTQNPLNFDSLQDNVQEFASNTLPADVRQAVLKEIQAYVRSQLQQ